MMTPFIAEFIGTAILLLLGAGVAANVTLKKTLAKDQTPLVINYYRLGFCCICRSIRYGTI